MAGVRETGGRGRTDQFPTAMSAPRDVQAQVASVIPLARFGPRTQTMLRQKFGHLDTSRTIGALGAARPSAPGQASAPAMAPVGTQPANTPVTIPPATGAGVGAGTRPALPPPEAPITPGAGGAQTAGPAAPTATVIPPSPPGSAADVEAIKAGMIGAGADPTTLAPGPGSALAPMPGRRRHDPGGTTIVAPVSDAATDTNGAGSDQLCSRSANAAKHQRPESGGIQYQTDEGGARRGEHRRYREAGKSGRRATGDRVSRTKKLGDAGAPRDRRGSRRAEHTSRTQRDLSDRQHREDTTGAVPLDPRQVTAAQKEQERYQKDYAEPGDKVAPLHGMLDQMEALDRQIKANPLGGQGGLGGETARKLRTFLTAQGYGDQGFTDTTANQEAYNTLHNQLVLRLKGLSGTSLGNMSNTDLAFLDAAGPGLNLTPEGRARTSAALRQILTYQKNLYDAATDAIHDPKGGFTLRDLNEKIGKVPPAIPTFPGFNVPKEVGQAWMEHNKPKRGTAYYGSDGQLRVWGVDPLQ